MKKLLALALAIVMMMAIALPAFAAAAEADPIYSDRVGDGNDESSNDNYLEDGVDQTIIDVDADDETKDDVEVKYGVAQAYTVTIPEAINLHQYNGDSTATQTKGYVYSLQNVKVEDVVLAANEYLNVYVKSNKTEVFDANGRTARTWCLVDTENTGDAQGTRVSYALRTDKFLPDTISGIENNGALLSCKAASGNMGTTGSTANTNLYFSSKGTAQEGTYIDYLTFTVKVETSAVAAVNDAPVAP